MEGNTCCDWLREDALRLAVTTYGNGEHPPQAIVAAAELFLEFLTGDYEV